MRTHCFISSTANASGARWAWHTADEHGVPRTFSAHAFPSFQECVDDAFVHGHHHVEVPLLDRFVEYAVAPAPAAAQTYVPAQPNA
jgi:hypothetical protein